MPVGIHSIIVKAAIANANIVKSTVVKSTVVKSTIAKTAIAKAVVVIFFVLYFGIAPQALSSHAPQTSAQQPSLILSNSEQRYDLVGREESSKFLPVPAGATIEDFFRYEISPQVQGNATNRPDFQGGKSYWFSINIVNTTEQPNWQLHISNFFIKSVELLVDDSAERNLYYSDFSQGVGMVDTNPIGRSFALHLPRDKVHRLVLRITANTSIWPPYLGIMDQYAYKRWSKKMSYLYTIAIGIVIGIILYNLNLFFLLFDTTYLWFCLSSALLLVFYLLRGNLGIDLFDMSYRITDHLWTLVSLTIITLLLFSYDFLKIDQSNSPYFHYAYRCTLGLSVVVYCLTFFLPKEINFLLYSINAAAMLVVIFVSGAIKVFRGEKYYLFFMLGWLPVVVSITEYIHFFAVSEQSNQLLSPSYKVIREIYFQIAHTLIHSVAMTVRIQKLRRDKLTAELASQAKSRFLASASHDLRQPLHAMGMFISSLKPHVSNADGKELLYYLQHSHHAMSKSFEALLDLSRLDAGAMQVHREQVPLQPLLTRLRREYSAQAQTKNLSLKIVDSSLYVDSDALLLERIVRNLLSNAIRYTSEGRVLVGCRRRGSAVFIEVWDTGCGIAEDKFTVIFDAYERVNSSRDHSEGIGLGLSIVRRTADLLNHRVYLKSRVGKGSVFALELPRVNPAEARQPLSHSDSQEDAFDDRCLGLNVGVLDDDPHICHAMSALLSQWGCKVFAVSSLRELNNALQRNTFIPDLLISDLHLSEQDNGLELLTCIKETQHRNMSMALMTADSASESLKVAQRHGIPVLLKPVNPAQLRALVNHSKSLLFAPVT